MFTDGLGLGLFLCRRVVQLMGGSLTLDTQYKDGSRFVLELPHHHDTIHEVSDTGIGNR